MTNGSSNGHIVKQDMLPDRDWRFYFLDAFRQTANIAFSIRSCESRMAASQTDGNVSRMKVWRERQNNADFEEAYQMAEAEAVDDLESRARVMAMSGDTQMMIFLLKAHRPEKFREVRRNEITGVNGGPLTIEAIDSIMQTTLDDPDDDPMYDVDPIDI